MRKRDNQILEIKNEKHLNSFLKDFSISSSALFELNNRTQEFVLKSLNESKRIAKIDNDNQLIKSHIIRGIDSYMKNSYRKRVKIINEFCKITGSLLIGLCLTDIGQVIGGAVSNVNITFVLFGIFGGLLLGFGLFHYRN